ncbi:MAG: glycosyltransferase family 9 protein [Alphaproteobacteria bacterium]|nr:glycosyltransferase family 9 protein [Alphaproteobacteria bacterium]
MTGPAAHREKILVIKLSALGDFLVALGPMAAIRKHHPDAHITIMTTRPFADMAQRSRYADAVEVVTRAKFYQIGAWLRMARFLNGGFDRVYDLQTNDRSGIYFRLMRKKPVWCGTVRGASDNYAAENPDWRQMHAFDRHKAMLARHGIDVALPDVRWMQTDVSLLTPKDAYVMLIPGCAPQHPYKRWPAAKFAALALKLQHQGYAVCLIGTAAEQEAIAKIKKAAPECHDLSGRTSLYDIASLAAGAAGAVGNDTGPSHLVALTGCPLVVLFSGVTDPSRSAPIGAVVTVIQSEDIGDISTEDVMKALRPRETTGSVQTGATA